MILKNPGTNRRNFLKSAAAGIGVTLLPSIMRAQKSDAEKTGKRMRLGMASYTFRKFPLDEAITMTKQLDIEWLALKSFHLPLESTTEQIKEAAAKVRDAGVHLYGAGVIYMKNEDEVNNAFAYAKAAGLQMIIGVPDHHLLPLVEKKVKESDIIVAIHNHGPGDERYPSPESVYSRIKEMDKRIGMCLDIGHVVRYGLDPVKEYEAYNDRIFDIHIKDVTEASADGQTTEIGRGIIDIPAFLRAVKNKKYQGILAFEFEKNEDDPLAGTAESVGYVRGVMDLI